MDQILHVNVISMIPCFRCLRIGELDSSLYVDTCGHNNYIYFLENEIHIITLCIFIRSKRKQVCLAMGYLCWRVLVGLHRNFNFMVQIPGYVR